MKEVARRFVAVLKPAVETVDRLGLKRYHLHKHRDDVARYFRFLSSRSFASELVLGREAASVRRPESLAAWLHGTACRLALRGRRGEARRQAREARRRRARP